MLRLPGGRRGRGPEPRVKPNYVVRLTLRNLAVNLIIGLSVSLTIAAIVAGGDPLLVAFSVFFAGAAGLVQAALLRPGNAYRSAVLLVNSLEALEWCLVGDLVVARLGEARLLAFQLPMGPLFLVSPSYTRERAVGRWLAPDRVEVSAAARLLSAGAEKGGGVDECVVRVTKVEVYQARFTMPSLKSPKSVLEGHGYVAKAWVKARRRGEPPECLRRAVKAMASLL